MTDLLTAFGLIALAELGDKSQLLALTFATRYRFWQVLLAIVVAEAVLLGVAAGLGGLLGSALPERLIAVVGGLTFLGFALWTVREGDGEAGGAGGEDAQWSVDGRDGRTTVAVLATITAAFLVAELGDKTMLSAAALASSRSPTAVWIGGVLGVTLASVAAIAIGRLLHRQLPARRLRQLSAVAFSVFGVLLLVEAAVA